MEGLLQDLTCPITLELFEDPVTVPCCGKAFSRAALVQQFVSSKSCPLCNGDLEDFDVHCVARNAVLSGMVDTVTALRSQQQTGAVEVKPEKKQHTWSCSLAQVANTKGVVLPIGELMLSLEDSRFAPMPSLFIAVVDRSGSMSGSPWKQVQTALLHILGLTRLRNVVKLVIIAYESNAQTIDISGPHAHVDQQIRSMNAGGGTNFRAAFNSIRNVMVDQKDQVSNVTVAFLTDGQATGDRKQLVGEFREQLHKEWIASQGETVSCPVSVHAIGFGAGCDKDFLECMRLAGSTEGTFRYAEPTDDGDTLCHKLTSLFEVACEASMVPVNLSLTTTQFRGGSRECDIQFPVNEQGRGEFSCWVLPDSEDPGSIVLNSEHDQDHSIAIQRNAYPKLGVFDRWLSVLVDELAAELLELGKTSSGPDVLELICALLDQRVSAISASTQDNHLQQRLEFIKQQIAAMRRGAGLHVGKLADMRFASRFSEPPLQTAPIPFTVRVPPETIPKAIHERPEWEMPVAHYSRNNTGMCRNKLQEAICNANFNEVTKDMADLLAEVSEDDLLHVDVDGNNSLHLAAYCGHSEILDSLLQFETFTGQTLEVENNDAETAVTLAVKKRGFDKSLRVLQQAGARLPRQKALERYCIDHGFVRTAEIISQWSGSSTEVNTSMSSSYITYLYELSVKQGTDIDVQSYLNAALAKCMQSLVHTLLDKHGARPMVEMMVEHCIPPKPDDPEVEKYLRLAEAVLDADATLINQEDEQKEAPLFKAAVKGSLPHVKLFLSRGAQIDQPNVLGNTALWIACAKRYPCIIAELLLHGADVNWVNLKGNVPMYAICQHGPQKIAEQLIAHGATLEHINKNGDTLILLCCRNGQHEVLRLLLKYVDPDFVSFQAHIDGFSAILASAEQSRPECIRVLKEYGTDLEQKTGNDNPILPGATPLHVAAYYNCPHAARALLELGAIPNSMDASQQTPLHTAVIQGHTEIITALIDAKADPMAVDVLGSTPLSYCRDRADIRSLLLNPAVDILMKLARGGFSKEQETIACDVLKRHSGMLGCLLASEAVDLRDHDGSSVLMHAVLHSSYAVVCTLLELGASPNSKNRHGLSPLLWANHIRNHRILHLMKQASREDDDTLVGQLASLKTAASNALNADIFFLGSPPSYFPMSASSGINSRMQEFVNAPCGDGKMLDMLERYSLRGEVAGQIVSLLKEGHEFDGIDWSPIIWEAKVLVSSLVASGTMMLQPRQAMILCIFGSNPHFASAVNRALTNPDRVSCVMTNAIASLQRALEDLPHYTGEAFVGAKVVDRSLFQIGTEFSWPVFWSASTLWRVAMESTPDFSAKAKTRKGTIFIVKSKTGRLIGQHSQFAFDSEVVFMPSTRLKVTNWYYGDVIALGQANIREHTFGIKDDTKDAMMTSDKSMIIELEEVWV